MHYFRLINHCYDLGEFLVTHCYMISANYISQIADDRRTLRQRGAMGCPEAQSSCAAAAERSAAQRRPGQGAAPARAARATVISANYMSLMTMTSANYISFMT